MDQEVLKKKFYKQWWFWVIIVLVLYIIGVSGNNSTSSNTVPSAPAQVADATTTPPSAQQAEVTAQAPAKSKIIKVPSNTEAPSVVTPAPTIPPPAPASWHTVNTFSGSGASNTDLFTIRGSKWQVQWTATADSNSGDTFCQNYASCNFDAFIYKPGGDYATDSIQAPINTTKNGVSYFYTTGQFYIKVDPYKIGNWSMIVEDYY